MNAPLHQATFVVSEEPGPGDVPALTSEDNVTLEFIKAVVGTAGCSLLSVHGLTVMTIA